MLLFFCYHFHEKQNNTGIVKLYLTPTAQCVFYYGNNFLFSFCFPDKKKHLAFCRLVSSGQGLRYHKSVYKAEWKSWKYKLVLKVEMLLITWLLQRSVQITAWTPLLKLHPQLTLQLLAIREILEFQFAVESKGNIKISLYMWKFPLFFIFLFSQST